MPFPSPISDECCLSTKTQEVLPAATQEVTNSTTGEELQAQVESLVHPVANSVPPVTTRKESPNTVTDDCVLAAQSSQTRCDPMDHVASQALLSMGFYRQEHQSGL